MIAHPTLPRDRNPPTFRHTGQKDSRSLVLESLLTHCKFVSERDLGDCWCDSVVLRSAKRFPVNLMSYLVNSGDVVCEALVRG